MITMMTFIEKKHLRGLASRLSVDVAEIDSSLTYYENKRNLLKFELGREHQGELDRFESSRIRGVYHKGAICPRCGVTGSGLHTKWVLNERKRRYEPYYYFAHSKNGKVIWHYIRKQEALNLDLDRKYNLK